MYSVECWASWCSDRSVYLSNPGQLKQSTVGFNSVFSFSYTGCFTNPVCFVGSLVWSFSYGEQENAMIIKLMKVKSSILKTGKIRLCPLDNSYCDWIRHGKSIIFQLIPLKKSGIPLGKIKLQRLRKRRKSKEEITDVIKGHQMKGFRWNHVILGNLKCLDVRFIYL